jgi:ribosomal protein L37E
MKAFTHKLGEIRDIEPHDHHIFEERENPAAVIHGMGSEPLEKIRAEEKARIERNKSNARFYCARCGRQHYIFTCNDNRKNVATCGSVFYPNGQPV